ncbi:hypothetical protein [Hyphomonas sp.]|uniref:hypothetical protein n=1 Tax=Hyphomonas sp. TaxID=87 RepID=UPI0032991C0F
MMEHTLFVARTARVLMTPSIVVRKCFQLTVAALTAGRLFQTDGNNSFLEEVRELEHRLWDYSDCFIGARNLPLGKHVEDNPCGDIEQCFYTATLAQWTGQRREMSLAT